MTPLIIMGGAFDPLHIGHVAMGEYVHAQYAGHPMVVVPTGQPVHKTGMWLSADVRLRMAQSVFGTWSNTWVSDVEIRTPGPSYAINTIHALMAEYGARRVIWVMGYDQLCQFHRWRRYEDILTHHHVVAFPRPSMGGGDGLDEGGGSPPSCPDQLGAYADRITILDWVPPRVSSSQIRRMIRQHQSIDGWVPPVVARMVGRYPTNL